MEDAFYHLDLARRLLKDCGFSRLGEPANKKIVANLIITLAMEVISGLESMPEATPYRNSALKMWGELLNEAKLITGQSLID